MATPSNKQLDRMVKDIVMNNGDGPFWVSAAQSQAKSQTQAVQQASKGGKRIAAPADDNSSYRGKSKQEKVKITL